MTLLTPDHSAYDRLRAKKELKEALEEADALKYDPTLLSSVCTKCGEDLWDCGHHVSAMALRTFLGEECGLSNVEYHTTGDEWNSAT